METPYDEVTQLEILSKFLEWDGTDKIVVLDSWPSMQTRGSKKQKLLEEEEEEEEEDGEELSRGGKGGEGSGKDLLFQLEIRKEVNLLTKNYTILKGRIDVLEAGRPKPEKGKDSSKDLEAVKTDLKKQAES